jgi:uroporphyrinogen decarboxylase
VCYFFASWGIPTILHSDGNISRIIPLLIKAGFRALHPVQYSAGLDIRDLKREYKRDVVFFGNFDIGILAYPREILETFLIERLDACKGDGGYIFGFDGPLGPDAKFEDYQFVLETVKAHGRY